MESKVSIIYPHSVWYHIADTLLVAEDLTRETSPALAHRLHTIATSIRSSIDLKICLTDSTKESDK